MSAQVGSEVEEMIGMHQSEYTRTEHRVNQKSLKQVSLKTGHSRQTVRKVLWSNPFYYAPRVARPVILFYPPLPL